MHAQGPQGYPSAVLRPESVMIGRVVLGSTSPAMSLEVSQAYTNARLFICGRGDTTSGEVDVYLNFNDDSGAAKYEHGQYYYNSGASATLATDSSDPRILLGRVPDSHGSNPTGAGGFLKVFIGGVNNRFAQKGVYAHVASVSTTSATLTMISSGTWLDTSPILKLSVTLSSGNWVVGSMLHLFGMP